jgi:tetratricopeptide (TPR) repeat protein
MGLFDRFTNEKKGDGPDPALLALLEQGQAAREQGHTLRALQLFGTLVERAQEQGNVAMEAAALQQRGVTWDLSGDTERAEADVRSAIALNRTLTGERAASVLRQDFHALGVILSGRGDHDAALTAFTESARWAEKAGEMENADKALINVALMHHALGHRERALELLEDTLRSERPRTVTASVHAALLVEWLGEQGRLEDALATGQESLAKAAYWRTKHSMGRISDDALGAIVEAAAEAQLHLTRRLVDANRPDEARQHLTQLLDWGEQLGIGGLQGPVDDLRRELRLGA